MIHGLMGRLPTLLLVVAVVSLAASAASAEIPVGSESLFLGGGDLFWPAWCTVDQHTTTVSINLTRAGTAARVSGPQLIIAGTEAELILATGGVTIEQGNAAGVVTSVSFQSHPYRFDGSQGLIAGSYRAELAGLPGDGARIDVAMTERPDPAEDLLFQQTAASNGYAIAATYGTMEIRMQEMPDIESSRVWMSAPREWISARGGITAVRILRTGGDGSAEVLETRFGGYGEEGTLVFEGLSPRGLSTFCLAAVEPAASPDSGETTMPEALAAAAPLQYTASDTTLAMPLTAATVEPVSDALTNQTSAEGFLPAAPFVLALAAAGCVVLASALLLGISRGSIRRIERRR